MLKRVTRLVGVAIRRLLLMAASVALASLMAGALARVVPGRTSDDLRLDPRLAPETIEAVERRQAGGMATEAQAPWRTLATAVSTRSRISGLPVGPLVVQRAQRTLTLTVPALVLAWGLALVLAATQVGAHRGHAGLVDMGVSFVQAVPDVVVALALVRVALLTGWFPVGGLGDGSRSSLSVADVAWHATLPVIALVAVLVPGLVRHVVAALRRAAPAELWVAAAARGLSTRRIYWRHALPAARALLAPIVGVSMAALLGVSLVVEVVFAWPGLGPLVVDAVLARDLPVVLGAVVVVAALAATSNVVADLLEAASTPPAP